MTSVTLRITSLPKAICANLVMRLSPSASSTGWDKGNDLIFWLLLYPLNKSATPT